MWLLIDDIRDLNCEVTARTPEAAKAVLPVHKWEAICFDHDLAADENGHDILKWAIENGFMAPHIQLVTDNPVGRQNMTHTLEANGYESKDGYNFFKEI